MGRGTRIEKMYYTRVGDGKADSPGRICVIVHYFVVSVGGRK